jgi:hypothetical protein
MSDIARTVFAIVGGLIVAALIIALVHFVSAKLYPLPRGLDVHDRAAISAAIQRLPTGAFLMVLGAWAAGAFCGGWVAGRIARRARVGHALVVGILLLMAGIGNLTAIPHPFWMWIGAFVVFSGGSVLGGRIASAKR